MDIILLLLAAGAAAGILAGLFGVGGGIIIVPVLIFFYSGETAFPVQAAIATSLFTIIFTAVSSSYRHYVNRNVNLTAAIFIGAAGSLTVLVMSKIAIGMSGDLLKKIFALVLLITSVKMLIEKDEPELNTESNIKSGKFLFMIIGVIGGIVTAFSGLGGGAFITPLMKYLGKFPIKKAIGTSSAAILFVSVFGALGYYLNSPAEVNAGKYSLGLIDTYHALPMIIASVPCAQLGVYFHKKTGQSLMRKMFAVFLILVAVSVWLVA